MDSSGIEVPDDQHIVEVEENGYKYFGIFQLDQTLSTKMKGEVTAEYIGRVNKLCRSKLTGGNRIRSIHVWAVRVIRYRAGILDWTTNELVNIDRRIKKILPLHGFLHVARPYLPRVEGQRGLIGIGECVKRENRSLCGYLRKNAANGFQG